MHARNAPVARREEKKLFPLLAPENRVFSKPVAPSAATRAAGGIRVEGACAMGIDISVLRVLCVLRGGAREIPRLNALAHPDLLRGSAVIRPFVATPVCS